MKSHSDFIGRIETEKYSRLTRNAETGDSDKEALFASAGRVEVSEFLGGDTRQATRAAQSSRFSQDTQGANSGMKTGYALELEKRKGADHLFTMTEEKRQLSNALMLLAEFYKPPTNELYQALRNGTALEELTPFVKLEETYKDAFSSYESMKQTYIHCFLGPSEPFAPPIESLYKQWTDDPTAAVSFARQTGFFYGDPAIHVQYLFQQYKLEFPEEYRAMPDHLTLLLEFLSFLLEHGTADQIHSFISDHFDWLDDFVEELKKADTSLFYVSITQIVNQLVRSPAFGYRSEQLGVERSE